MSRYVDVSPHAIDRYLARVDPTASRRTAALAIADALRGARRLHGQGDNRAHYLAPDGGYRLVVAQDGQVRVIVTVLPPADGAPGDDEAAYEGVRVVPAEPPPAPVPADARAGRESALERHNARQAAAAAAMREAMEGKYRRQIDEHRGRAARAWRLLLTCLPHVPPPLAAAIVGTVPAEFTATGVIVDADARAAITETEPRR